WWLSSPHGQTIAGRLLRRPHPPAFQRIRLDTPDGDFLDLDVPPPPRENAPIVVLFHGLEGSARRGYAINTYRELFARGIAAIGVNFRSCSGEPNRTARFYHSGETGDLHLALDYVATRFPGTPIGAVGFSLGGNALLKYLGEMGESAIVTCAVAISVPYDLAAGARQLESSAMGRFYSRHFIRSLIAKAEMKAGLLADKCELERVRRARTFYEFDDAATAPLHGFASADDYYMRSSSGPYIDRIRRPVLLVHAEDDPFVPPEAVPRARIDANPWVKAAITRAGGHVGFIAGPPWAPRFWVERQAARFLAAQFANPGSRIKDRRIEDLGFRS
ncbi:MAG TPA: alpha/beta fold hydrolase, partial [Longimicrobiales bacterium]|nr:alpha/beta fold hydrolase [Longimicrobiales bacterium]